MDVLAFVQQVRWVEPACRGDALSCFNPLPADDEKNYEVSPCHIKEHVRATSYVDAQRAVRD